MKLPFTKMSGAGNDFIMIDNRSRGLQLSETQIHAMCTRRKGIGADGLILLELSEAYDFTMRYYNADGRLGSMCGNGGRCAVMYAYILGAVTHEKNIQFEANGQCYHAEVNDQRNVTLKMQPPYDFNPSLKAQDYECAFINTGSPHAILFVEDIQHTDVIGIGKTIRHDHQTFKDGTNVNFVEVLSDGALKLRTFERGVEDETLACGTGAVAAALVSYKLGKTSQKRIDLTVHSQDKLTVRFDEDFKDVFLEGPAVEIYKGEIDI
jgi:diaminopimelate epimerase